jgi:hypothetical protein
MSENAVPEDARSVSPACESARRTVWSPRTLKIVCVGLFVGLGACVASLDSDNNGEAATSKGRLRSTELNLCRGQVANTFHCIDDTSFQLCTGDGTFVVNSCPPGLCATRTPADRNPCIGRERAAEIDGVEPPAPDQASPPADDGDDTGEGDTGDGDGDTGEGDTGGNTGAQCSPDGLPGPRFDPAGAKNVGNGQGGQFIGGQCLSAADCASACCALPCGICSGPGAQFQAGKQGCGFEDTGDGDTGGGDADDGDADDDDEAADNTGDGDTGDDNNAQCTPDGLPGPRFDPAGAKNVGNDQGLQFIGGQCLSAADCASACCALPCGICSGPGAQFQAGKQGCGFGD